MKAVGKTRFLPQGDPGLGDDNKPSASGQAPEAGNPEFNDSPNGIYQTIGAISWHWVS